MTTGKIMANHKQGVLTVRVTLAEEKNLIEPRTVAIEVTAN